MATRRLYYEDSFLRTFEAQVTGCERVIANRNPAFAVTLDRTAFYPTSGGQPNDTGKLGESRVLDVHDEGEEIIHILDQPPPKGSISGCVDWHRRFDHMQQHTGQHLLSAVLQERFGLPTVSFHLGAAASTIDVRGKEPGAEVLEGVERASNQIIFEDRSITVRYGTAEQLAELGVRKQVEREGILRAIDIERLDLQPCGGTHVARTGQIGLLLVRGCSRIREDWRIEFVCGARVEVAARTDHAALQGISKVLRCAYNEVSSSASKLLAERDAQFKTLRAVTERLAEAEADLALREVRPTQAGLRIVARVLENVEPIYLAKFATHIARAERAVALLVRRECGHLAFAQHPSAGNDMNAILQRVVHQLGGKGGGTLDFARGGLARQEDAERAVELAVQALG